MSSGICDDTIQLGCGQVVAVFEGFELRRRYLLLGVRFESFWVLDGLEVVPDFLGLDVSAALFR